MEDAQHQIMSWELESELAKVIAQIREIHGSNEPLFWNTCRANVAWIHDLLFKGGAKP